MIISAPRTARENGAKNGIPLASIRVRQAYDGGSPRFLQDPAQLTASPSTAHATPFGALIAAKGDSILGPRRDNCPYCIPHTHSLWLIFLPVGVEPATFTCAAQTITQLEKRTNRPMVHFAHTFNLAYCAACGPRARNFCHCGPDPFATRKKRPNWHIFHFAHTFALACFPTC